MKEQKNRDTLYSILIVAGVALLIFALVQISYLKKEQKQLIDSISVMQQNVEYSAFSFSDQVTWALGIITAGIGVFAIFGGIISVINLFQFKQMDKAIKMSEKAIEYQRELQCASFIQEGRIYIARERKKYAENCFIRAVHSAPGSYMGLVAKYELLQLHADTALFADNKNKERIEAEADRLITRLNKKKIGVDSRYRTLRGDTYFLMACVYGNYSLENNKKENLDLSEEKMMKAISCDRNNVDYYRNLAITYALKNDKEKCKKYIEKAKKKAQKEPLYADLVEKSRLKKLFERSWNYLSQDMKDMLQTEIGIISGDQP